MKGKQSGKKYQVYYLGLTIALLWIVLPVFAKNVLYRTMDVLHAPLQTGAAKAGEIQDNWAMRLNSKNRLIEENRRLGRELARARMELNQKESDDHYVNRLERLLSLDPVLDHHLEYARIIRRDVNAWFEMLVLDKGSRHGLEVGQAVVSEEGLVGRVSEVGPFHSKVSLISSPGFRVTVNAPNDDRPIAYSGAGQLMWEPLRARVQHVPQDLVPTEQDAIPLYTSGLGEGLPEGLFVGELVGVEPELEGLFQKGEVRLRNSLRSLREVAILIPLEQSN